MSETTMSFVCYYCGQSTTIAEDVLPRFEEGNGFECVAEDACKRRQKRNQILAEMQEMARTPHLHPVDKITRTGVAICAFFMGVVIAMGLAYLWFGI